MLSVCIYMVGFIYVSGNENKNKNVINNNNHAIRKKKLKIRRKTNIQAYGPSKHKKLKGRDKFSPTVHVPCYGQKNL